MFVTYKPEGEPEHVWEFDPSRVRMSELEMIEKRAGEKTEPWLQSLQMGSARARRVLLWHLLRQDHPTLRFEDVPDFRHGELVIERSVAEVMVLSDRLSKMKMDDSERETLASVMEVELLEAQQREGLTIHEGEVVPGKSRAVSKKPARSTGSTRPTTSTSDHDSSTS